MYILTINSWSSSLKCKLFDMPSEKAIYEWQIDEIWFDNWIFPNHKTALKEILEQIKKNWININKIKKIWHRVVHWWEKYQTPTIITQKVINSIKKFSELAPLHNPANLEWILSCQELIPDAIQVAIFDTAFHQTMLAENFMYALPYKYYKKYKIRRYGFHWISHQYVFEESQKIEKSSKVISCHIGNWASITAISNGQVIENSMGFTPLSWLIMWTRSGDIDPEVILYLMKKEKINLDEIDDILNKKSWLIWVQWETNHMKTITEEYQSWLTRSKLAFKMYINSIVKYIGAYTALLNGVDTIIFTGWVLEKPFKEPAIIRTEICRKLEYLWIEIDQIKNQENFSWSQIITTYNSKTKIIIIPTNEELSIAKQTLSKTNSKS